MPIRVIINADDFGLNTSINLSIRDLLEKKLITSSTIIANGPCFKQAVAIASLFPMCSFGVHLNITTLRPLTSNLGLKKILDKNGNFNDKIFYTYPDYRLKTAIFAEWCAQIRKINSHGIKISHIDSHKHVHTIPKLFGILKRTQKKCKIKKVRITRNIYSLNRPIRSKSLLYKKLIWNFALKNIYKTKTTSGFTNFGSFYDKAKEDRISHETVELMVHPGNTQKYFKEEIDKLAHLWFKKIPMDLKLINYNQL
jgi:predicted glycoside hydrolase/deacetylase ChbG (UPF0249 family)